MSFTRRDSVAVAASCSFSRSARSCSNCSGLSSGRTQKAPAKPWRKLLRELAAFPASETGPVENWALSRLACSFESDTRDLMGVLLVLPFEREYPSKFYLRRSYLL